MKKIIAALIIVTLSIGLGGIRVYADSTTDQSEKTPYEKVIQTRIVHSYEKSIPITFPNTTSLSDIPMTQEYTEYNESLHAWFSGTLYFYSINPFGESWVVIYKGYLVGLL